MLIGVDATALVKNRTGVGNYIYEILSVLVKDKSNFFLLYSNSEIYFPDEENVKKIVHSPYRKGPAWQNTQLLRSLFIDKPDVYWGGNGYLPIFSPKKTKLVLTVHDLVYKYAGETMPFLSRLSRKYFQPLSVRRADKIVAVSQATGYEMQINYGRKPDKIVHPQISSNYVTNVTSNHAYVEDKYGISDYMLTIGTLEPRKNMVTLIKAYLEVTKQGYSLPQLVIVGGKGWMQNELNSLVESGVSKGVIRKLGYVPDEDLPLLYSCSKAFILASTYEGFGMPVLEAQASGCPVIISNIPSMKEAANNVCCLFEPTIKSIAQTLRKLERGELPMSCRLKSDILNDSGVASRIYLELMEES
ncbi:glycosyltransferase family 4 protein [Vibrio parahaemolyticus]|uniref:glycosyltransferase family 4 protein n=1 Tax=Vibrio parahaemolyticus TaxID=670 RepID=UPI0009B60108|nr:glycosyltransferase family 1 protein [Vibrio parahaemolyticus]EHJ9992227.1 glycosyltransferase family 4 protein [Vibrio parahaemolyticus]MCG0008414.1 glycosyltransferase family 4 protein [Vibrio parahaemolyticus]MCG0013171.1 glycosyltransferase family 4 protein [Vibrio parahaemolyticus]MDL1999102.1 glycosyltransferase family 4 protein [Vibrio parahaemolyticus]MDL2021043.1 glycosyltransferase family 4 protein [Vibrio parahaemolyticus]